MPWHSISFAVAGLCHWAPPQAKFLCLHHILAPAVPSCTWICASKSPLSWSAFLCSLLHEYRPGGGLPCAMEWATCLISEGTGRWHVFQAFHATENTCLCIQAESPSACSGSPCHIPSQVLILAIMSHSALPFLPGDRALWFPIFIRTGSFVLKTCFCFWCFLFALGIFWLGNCVSPVDHEVWSVSYCLVFLSSWSQADMGGHLLCVRKFTRNTNWKWDTKILHVHKELEENIVAFIMLHTGLRYKCFHVLNKCHLKPLNHSV